MSVALSMALKIQVLLAVDEVRAVHGTAGRAHVLAVGQCQHRAHAQRR